MPRVRNRAFYATEGYATTVANGTLVDTKPSNCLIYEEQCSDTHDQPGIDHPFFLSRFQGNLNPANGIHTGFWWKDSELRNFYPPGGANSLMRSHVALSNTISSADFIKLRSRTNPSRPEVTPFELIQDVVEIPKMLKDVGRLLKKGSKPGSLSAKDLANQNLAIQFGWMPLVQDVKDLLNLQHHVHRRAKELDRLGSSKGLKRRIKLDSANAESQHKDQVMVSENAGHAICTIKRYSSSQKWGTIRWKPSVPVPYQPGSSERIRQAQQIVTGMTSEGAVQGLWNVLPWTWIVDWFVPVGDFLNQHSNTVPATPQNLNVMRKTVTSSHVTRQFGHVLDDAWVSGADGDATYVTLERQQSSFTSPASLPFIGLKRLSILGSLFVQRFK